MMSNRSILSSVPARPDLFEKIRRTKRFVRSAADMSMFAGPDVLDLRTFAKIISRLPSSRARTLVSPTRDFRPVVGTVRGLVLLVDFSDNSSSEQPGHFEQLLFSQGTYATGSFRDFYHGEGHRQILFADVFCL